MSFMLALILAALPQEDPTLTKMPEGWITGKKSGWDGDYPPGWEKKSDEDKEKFLQLWNQAKFKYIKAVQGAKGLPTGLVTAIDYMLRAVNGGLLPHPAAELAIFGQNQKLKDAEFKIMMKASTSVHGTEVPHGEAVNIIKDLVITGIRGPILDQRIRAEIKNKDNKIKAAKKKDDEKKDPEKNPDKGKETPKK